MKSAINFALLTLFVLLASSQTSQTITQIAGTCLNGCANCTTTTCTQCQDGYRLAKGGCIRCPTGCKTCQKAGNVTHCGVCMNDYQIGINSEQVDYCFKCDPICETCSQRPNNCATCKEGYEISASTAGTNQTCVKKACNVTNCANCVAGTTNQCQQCKRGTMKFKGLCIPCESPCALCILPVDALAQNEVKTYIEEVQAANSNVTRSPSNNISVLDVDTAQGIPAGDKQDFLLQYICSKLYNKKNVPKGNAQEGFNCEKIANQIRLMPNPSLDDIKSVLGNKTNEAIQEYQKNGPKSGQLSNHTNQTKTNEELFEDFEAEFNKHIECVQCVDGYKVDLATSKCKSCRQIEGCLECSPNGCVKCDEGYSHSTATGLAVCKPCHDDCLTCEDGNQTACTSCKPSFSLNADKQCVECKRPCLSCPKTNTSSCLRCIDTYSRFPNAQNECYKCEDSFCAACNSTNTSICMSCKEGTNLVNDQCERCSENCISCEELPTITVVGAVKQFTCVECRDGFFVNEAGNCSRCSNNCEQCSSRNTCETCAAKYFLQTDGSCASCPKKCDKCDDTGKCLVAKKGFTVCQKKIMKCKGGCERCEPCNPSKCFVPKKGWFVNPNSQVRRCSKKCVKCTDQNTCLECRKRWILDGNHGNCTRCSKESKCLTCQASTPDVCTSCPRKLILNDNGLCTRPCRKYCVQCNEKNTSVCIQCKKGFSPDKNGKCVICVADCDGGKCNPEKPGECITCEQGFEKINGKCEKCPKNAKSCINGNAVECYDDFVKTEGTNGTICKEKCLGNCDECTGTICTKCGPLFIETPVSGQCVPDLSCGTSCQVCPSTTRAADNGQGCTNCTIPNCEDCGSTECFSCLEGYYLANIDICSPCPDSCLTCNSNDSCLRCKPGYFRQKLAETTTGEYQLEDTCTQCDAKCKDCKFDADQCTQCADDKTLKGDSCKGRTGVGFTFVFDVDYQQFVSQSMIMTLIEAIQTLITVDATDFQITVLKEGSTEVGGEFSSENQGQAEQSVSTLESNQNSLGFSVLSSSFSVNFDGEPVAVDTASSNEIPLALVIGCSVGGVVLIAIIIFVVYKVKFSSSNKVSEMQSSDIQRMNRSKEYQVEIEDIS